VMDLPAEFYLETVKAVFQDHLLPLGQLKVRGRKVEPRAIKRTAPAQDLCSGLRPHLKAHVVQTGAGHYGVFSGRRWNNEVYPVLRQLIQMGY